MPILPILVTGGLGFLGSHLCTRLAATGETVRILARPERRAEAPDSPHEIVWGDIRDPAAVERAVRGTEVVMHLASNFRRAGSDAKEAYPINVEGTRIVAEACSRGGVRQLIHCSTIGVHGSVVEVPAREESALSPLDLYQETKLLSEAEAWRAHQEDGLAVTVLRPASIYGPGDRRMLKLFRLIQKRRYVMLGDGEAFFHPAYVEDVAEAFVLALRNDRANGETFIVGGEEYVSLNEMVAMIAEELGVPSPRLRFPLAPIMALAALCERLCAPFGLEPPLHRRRVSFFSSRRAFSIEKARRVLGFQPRFALREGLRATIRWYREQGWL